MKEGQTRKTRTGNVITYRKVTDIGKPDRRGLFKVYLSCGHYVYMKDVISDRIKLFSGYKNLCGRLIGCRECGKEE